MSKPKYTLHDRVVRKFGKNATSQYIKMSGSTLHAPVSVKCPSCRKIYQTTGNALVNWKVHLTCTNCSTLERASKQARDESSHLETIAEKFPYISVANFKSNHKAADYLCTNCGNEWRQKPYEVEKTKFGCPKCATAKISEGRKLDIEEVNKRLEARNIKLLSKYSNTTAKAHLKCGVCDTTWKTALNSIFNGSGCPSCAKPIAMGHYYEYDLQGRIVKVQGYEPEVLDWLLKKGKKNITVFSEGKIDPIPYVFNGKQVEHFPDIKFGNQIVEVKSDYTFAKDFLKNKAKLESAIKLNLKYNFVIYDEVTRRCIILPNKEVLSWKKVEQFERWYSRKTVGDIISMGIDPGTTNCAWSVLKFPKDGGDPILLATGMFENKLTDITTDVKRQLVKMSAEFRGIVEEFRVNTLGVERFQSRGLKGSTIECVGMMIGYLSSVFYNYRSKNQNVLAPTRDRESFVVTAATWKNEWNRVGDLKAFYDTKVGLEIHQKDSMGIAIYAAKRRLMQSENPYIGMDTKILNIISDFQNRVAKTNYGNMKCESARPALPPPATKRKTKAQSTKSKTSTK